ncbi:MAG: leucine-rich repeat domain-containing protein [Crocinitomicaceae bacterium]
MRSVADIFLISSIFIVSIGFGQRSRIFTSMDEALTVHPDSVYHLDLSKQKLTVIPSEIKQFKNLQHLDLSKNKITALESDFIFSDLRILDLSKNKLEHFPEVICQNTGIRNLFMGKNDMKEIPECIGNLQNLIVLDIWYNPIDDLPESMTKLRNLRSLDLSGLNFSKEFQKKWTELLPWVKIEFESACDCNN